MLMVRRLLAYCSSVLLFFLAAEFSNVRAQTGKYEGLTVTNIQFSPEDEQPLTAAERHDLLPLQTGRPLVMRDVRASIERLFATGRYADIQVDAQPYRNGVAVTFVTTNSWFVGGVSVGGGVSSPPSPGQLENATQLNLGQPFNDSKVQLGIAGQKRLLEANGLFHASVEPAFDWESGKDYQQVNIGFTVNTGPRAHYTTPVFLGDLKVDQKKIFTATRFRRWLIHTWKPVTQTRTRQAIEGVRSLYQNENRLQARVTLESSHYDPQTNSVQPTFRIDAGPRIEVRVVGADISNKVLRRYVPIFEERTVDNDLLAEGQRNLRDYLQAQGYFEADVQFKPQRVINDRAAIDYLVATGARHKLVAIQIKGNRYFSTESIRERMFLQTASLLQFRHGRYSQAFLARDEQSIANLYQSNGFRDVKVTHTLVDDYLGKEGEIAVVLDIDEGPQYFVEKLEIKGIERLNQQTIVSRLSSAEGQPFSEFNVAVDRDTILAQYFENGFPDVTFEWSADPSADPHRVVLHFVVHEGRQQFVRQVIVSGNEVTRTELIDRNLKLNPGDPLSPNAITNTQRRLYDLGVFARVDAAIQDPDGDTPSKYVLYNLDEARRYSMATGFGAELGRIGGCTQCFEAPAGAAGFSPRVSFDLTRNNLWGLTHSLGLRTRASFLNQRALLNYSWPRFEQNDNLTVSFTGLFENSRDIRTFSYQRVEASAQLTQRLTKATTLFYRLAYRRVGVRDVKISPYLVPQLSQPVRVGIVSINAVRDRRDDPLEPHKGTYNTLDLGLAERALGSQPNFFRLLARNASYYSLGKRLVLARSTQVGNIYPFSPTGSVLDAVPLPERFFGGGGTSHRAFPEDQAGPRDTSTGFPLGGTALLFNQTEIRFPLVGDNLGGVLYHDVGNIYTSYRSHPFRLSQNGVTDFDYLVHSVGFGIRYKTPVGPVRVDLGYDPNPPAFFGVRSGATEQDLINAGTSPCTPPDKIPGLCVSQHVNRFQFFFSIGQTF